MKFSDPPDATGPGARIAVGDRVLETIRRHVEAVYPEEACGGLLGHVHEDGAAELLEAITLENTRRDERARRYLVAPDDVLALERRAEDDGLEVLGYFHSHPDAPATPSPFDREHAWPGYIYMIVSVSGGRAFTARAWQLRDDRADFRPVAINDHAGVTIEDNP